MCKPELLVNDAHGRYMMQTLIAEGLPQYLLDQIKEKIGSEYFEDLGDVENEHHFDACDAVTNCTLKHKDGWEFFINYFEGGLYAIPLEFLESKEYEEFFNN